MAVTITDTRTLIDEGDATTDWTGADGLYTADPYPVESTGSIGAIVSNETQDVYHTHGSNVDLSAGVLVYVWALPQGIMDTATNGGIGVHMGDGTDRISYHIGGSDQAGFRHDQASVGWQCFVIDSSSLPTLFTARAGTEASLTWTTITQFGITFKTLVKSVGGVENCFVDVIRYGNTGLRIAGGTSGDPGTFSEISIEDRSSTTGQAYGVIHQIGEGLFGLQGPFTFGDGVGIGASYFADTNTTVAFEDRGIGTDKYYINVAGNSVGSATFQLGTQVGTTTSGSDGCTLLCPAGVGASFDASDADIDFVYLYGSIISGFNNGVSFSADATNGPNHEVYDCTFTGCGQIDPGQVLFKNNRISDSTDSATGAVLLDSDSTTDWSDLSFTSGGTGHAIYITATGTYTFTNFFFTNYSEVSLGSNLVSSTGSTDAMIYNLSSGAVTINITGGDNISVRNGASATTTVNNNINVTVTIKDEAGSVIPGVETAIFQDDASRTAILASTETDESGQVSTTAAASLGDIIIRARQSTETATFHTGTGVATATEIITTDTVHNFQDGDAVTYDKDGGSAAIGLTDTSTYYVHTSTLTTSTLYLYDTAVNAIAGGATGKQDLTSSGTEIHNLDPVRYIAASATGTIGAGDFSAQITMITDTIATG